MYSATQSIIATLLVALSMFPVTVQGASYCSLCAAVGDLPTRWNYEFSDGRTCADLYVDLGNTLASDSSCSRDRAMAQDICCGYVDVPTPAPVYTGGTGNEPSCPICGTMEYPGIPTSFLIVRYVGEYTCGQLYERGINGLIPEFMCGPLQDYAYSICGCGPYNPACIADSTKCWGYSGPTPTAPTGPSPTPAPVSAPSIANRKTPPEGSKYSTRLSDGRGGSAGGSKRQLRGE